MYDPAEMSPWLAWERHECVTDVGDWNHRLYGVTVLRSFHGFRAGERHEKVRAVVSHYPETPHEWWVNTDDLRHIGIIRPSEEQA